MATLESLTLNTFTMLYGQTPVERPDFDILDSAVASAADDAWQFRKAGTQFWERGDYAEAYDGTGTAGEVIQLTEAHDQADADVIVLRGDMRGAAAAASYAAGAVFLRNPSFTHTEIQRFINEVIDSDLNAGNQLWYRSARTLTPQTGRTHYPLNASDFKVDRVYQFDINSDSLGTATFDVSGGTSEDLWTLASHGLSVGDPVRFTAVGTGAAPYAVDTVYWVATVPTANTFQLSATESTTVLEGTSTDTVGTWTLEKVVFNYREFPSTAWSVVQGTAGRMESTTQALLLRSVVSQDETVYYDARTRPSSSAVSSLPTQIVNLIPWGVLSRITGGTAIRSRYAPASTQPTVAYADSEFFRKRFEMMVDDYRRRLLSEVPPPKRWIYGPLSVG